MHVRRNITALAAACVGLAVLAACVAAYVGVRRELYGQIDAQLRESRFIARGPRDAAALPPSMRRAVIRRLPDPSPSKGGPPGYVQTISRTGVLRRLRGDVLLPVDPQTRRIAAQARGATAPRTVEVRGDRVRVIAFGAPPLGAVEVGRSLEGVDHVLARLRLVLVFVLLGGVALAAFLARRVGGRFSGVLGALEATNSALDASLTAQRQLVADASHELRTPVTSLRTNVEVLADSDALDPQTRAQLVEDMRHQTEELSALVADVIELARGDAEVPERQCVRLDELAREAVARARRHAPRDVEIALDARPATVDGAPDRLWRAMNNLLDNAVRHAPPGTCVRVTAGPDGIVVRDHGAGVDPDELPHLFDRFYRGVSSRGAQGTGLGLAIVRQVAEAHGGTVSAANAEDGGAEFRLVLPGRTVDAATTRA